MHTRLSFSKNFFVSDFLILTHLTAFSQAFQPHCCFECFVSVEKLHHQCENLQIGSLQLMVIARSLEQWVPKYHSMGYAEIIILYQ